MMEGNWGDLVDAQILSQGTSAIRVKDGMVFTFTKEVLRKLLSAAEIKGEVVILVRHVMRS